MNSLIIIVITYGSLMKTSVFMILLLSLAIADNLALISVILRQNGVYTLLIFSQSIWTCRVIKFIIYSSTTISSWLIVLISIERFIAVFYPLRAHMYCTRRNLLFTISILFVIICMFYVPILFIGHVTYVNTIYVCHGFSSEKSLISIYVFLVAMAYCIIPFCIISILNIRIVKKIHSHSKFRAKHHKKAHDKSNLTFTMLAVCFFFIMTILPANVCYVLKIISKLCDCRLINIPDIVYEIVNRIMYLNHSANFVLYCLTGSVFRKTLMQLLSCCKRNKPATPTQRQCKTVEETVL